MKHTLLVITLLISSLGVAQNNQKTTGGFWNNNSATSSEEISTSEGIQSAPGLPNDNPGNDTPVGEGIFFLLSLAGGYGLIRFKCLNYSKKANKTNQTS